MKKIFTKIKRKQIKISRDQNTFFIKSNSFINSLPKLNVFG